MIILKCILLQQDVSIYGTSVCLRELMKVLLLKRQSVMLVSYSLATIYQTVWRHPPATQATLIRPLAGHVHVLWFSRNQSPTLPSRLVPVACHSLCDADRLDKCPWTWRPTVQPQSGAVCCATGTHFLFTVQNLIGELILADRLCGLVITIPGYRSRGPRSIPRAIRFSEK
jgi:hypothetical protein